MITVQIKQYGDPVYWLSSSGFKKGTVLKTFVVSDLYNKLHIKYECTCPDYHPDYKGDEPEFVFDTWYEMIEFYKKNEPK